MKKLQNEKGVVPIIIVILAVIAVGVGYTAYQSFSQKPTLLETNFAETGNILNWDSQTESYIENWTLLYEKPGNPAISVKLVFNEASLCDLGEGGKVCEKSEFNNGDRARVGGNRNNGEVTVINLTKL